MLQRIRTRNLKNRQLYKRPSISASSNLVYFCCSPMNGLCSYCVVLTLPRHQNPESTTNGSKVGIGTTNRHESYLRNIPHHCNLCTPDRNIPDTNPPTPQAPSITILDQNANSPRNTSDQCSDPTCEDIAKQSLYLPPRASCKNIPKVCITNRDDQTIPLLTVVASSLYDQD